jgi:hypothetical protein
MKNHQVKDHDEHVISCGPNSVVTSVLGAFLLATKSATTATVATTFPPRPSTVRTRQGKLRNILISSQHFTEKEKFSIATARELQA